VAGFLGTGATFLADVNLVVQLSMGVALLIGMMLARRKRYGAHKFCQSAVILLNVVMIGLIMAPSFRQQVASQIPADLGDAYDAMVTVHAVLGTVAELLGLYIVLVAATHLVPPRLRFKQWKPWMRTALALWWVVLLFGVGNYALWYLAPSGRAELPRAAVSADRVTVKLADVAFSPKVVTVVAGTIVEWTNEQGRHTVEADDGSFTSPTREAGDRFEHTFDQPGEFPYHCRFHGDKGGRGMAGVVKVLPRAQ
jgi:plastocyanin/uncharacterized membrane protein YozB (DUF420 family)